MRVKEKGERKRKKEQKTVLFVFSMSGIKKRTASTPQMLSSRGFCLPSERAATSYFPPFITEAYLYATGPDQGLLHYIPHLLYPPKATPFPFCFTLPSSQNTCYPPPTSHSSSTIPLNYYRPPLNPLVILCKSIVYLLILLWGSTCSNYRIPFLSL